MVLKSCSAIHFKHLSESHKRVASSNGFCWWSGNSSLGWPFAPGLSFDSQGPGRRQGGVHVWGAGDLGFRICFSWGNCKKINEHMQNCGCISLRWYGKTWEVANWGLWCGRRKLRCHSVTDMLPIKFRSTGMASEIIQPKTYPCWTQCWMLVTYMINISFLKSVMVSHQRLQVKQDCTSSWELVQISSDGLNLQKSHHLWNLWGQNIYNLQDLPMT